LLDSSLSISSQFESSSCCGAWIGGEKRSSHVRPAIPPPQEAWTMRLRLPRAASICQSLMKTTVGMLRTSRHFQPAMTTKRVINEVRCMTRVARLRSIWSRRHLLLTPRRSMQLACRYKGTAPRRCGQIPLSFLTMKPILDRPLNIPLLLPAAD